MILSSVRRILKTSPLGGLLRTLQARYELRHLSDDQYREQRDDRAMWALMAGSLAPDACAVDVGANRGRVLAAMVELAPGGQHLAVEPIPHLARALKAAFPTVQVESCALSDETGHATFTHVVTMDGWSGLKPPEGGFPGQTVEEIPVSLRRLDDLVTAGRPVRFIKIDVEGAELQVLRGALATIRRCRPVIVFEYGEGHGLPYGTTPEMIYDCMTDECGLTVRSLLGRQRRLSRTAFVAACRHATATKYDRASEGNFLATPD